MLMDAEKTCCARDLHIKQTLFPPGTDLYCPPEYRMKGEFHGKPATVWALGILLFRMVCGDFPDTFDLYRTNMNTWHKPGLTEGDLFITS